MEKIDIIMSEEKKQELKNIKKRRYQKAKESRCNNE